MSSTRRLPHADYRVKSDQSSLSFKNDFLAPFLELIEFKELIKNIVSRDLKKRYKRSVLGIAWTVVAPLFSMLVLWMVFTNALKVEIENYPTYLLSGIITWNFFVQSSASGGISILTNASFIQKIRLPRVIFPISAVFNNLINFFFSFVALIIVMLSTKASFHWTILLTPIMIIPLFLFVTGWTMAVSALSVFFRDIQYILEISLGALYFLTPILYLAEAVPGSSGWIISANPMAKFIHLFRAVVWSGKVPPLETYLFALLIGFITLILGWIVFQKSQRKFAFWL
jgi:ABC-2 type transport system permease protein